MNLIDDYYDKNTNKKFEGASRKIIIDKTNNKITLNSKAYNNSIIIKEAQSDIIKSMRD
jgi:hypothetical protein